uniref:Uncharacterized protein n=1 Tax=Glossina brevipalpis TaxID=37001 RepID=A0A1A9WII2_9MUSC
MVVPVYDRVNRCNCNNTRESCAKEVIENYKDIAVNHKEIRIVQNASNLRFIGNGNRIRIENNAGDLLLIGNKTSLKVQRNHGKIKYIGNEGRINLGKESSEQSVEYIGCEGILKICDFFHCEKHQQPSDSVSTHTQETKTRPHKSSKVSKKSHIFGGYHNSQLNQQIDELTGHKKIPVKTLSDDYKKISSHVIQNIENIKQVLKRALTSDMSQILYKIYNHNRALFYMILEIMFLSVCLRLAKAEE